MAFFVILIFFLAFAATETNAQVAMGQSDRTQQELALFGWTAALRTAYCQQVTIQELIDPFKEAISRMLNRHCKNAPACRLKKSVNFSKHQIVLLDGYPRREHRTLHFRFFVVLPHDAAPIGKKPDKPLLSNQILSEMLDSQIGELSHGLGWQVLGYDKYPRFDPATTFFNRTLIPIAILAGLCMFFLAYWTTAFTSGSSFYAGGWLVRGSSGGKNAALRRTMEIIEEQKYRFALYDAQRGVPPHSGLLPPSRSVVVYKSNERVKGVQGPPKSLATSYSSPQTVEANRATPIIPAQPGDYDDDQHQRQQQKPGRKSGGIIQPHQHDAVATKTEMIGLQPAHGIQQKYVGPTKSSFSTLSGSGSTKRREMEEMEDVVPEIVVMHAHSSSQESKDTATSGGRRVSTTADRSHRRQSRRISSGGDEFKRKKSSIFGGPAIKGTTQPERQKRWKASSLVLSKFSSAGMSRK
uniref:Chloride channel CLIC-like protein 1 n=1 Tax=Globodera rostochiensis TaxID=31243 RepID=A0A914I2K7_GLORO